MEIPGWAYILVGVVVSGISGYIYKFVPNNGKPNASMALFFFVGMLFILVGVAKFFFKRVDSQEAMVIEKMGNTPMHELDRTEKMNRVEEQVRKAYQQNAPNKPASQLHHSSTYAQSHPFHTDTQQHAESHPQPAHPQHASQQHPTHHMSQQIPHNSPHHISQQMSTMTCKKCGTVNHSASNYCHKCGNRLR